MPDNDFAALAELAYRDAVAQNRRDARFRARRILDDAAAGAALDNDDFAPGGERWQAVEKRLRDEAAFELGDKDVSPLIDRAARDVPLYRMARELHRRGEESLDDFDDTLRLMDDEERNRFAYALSRVAKEEGEQTPRRNFPDNSAQALERGAGRMGEAVGSFQSATAANLRQAYGIDPGDPKERDFEAYLHGIREVKRGADPLARPIDGLGDIGSDLNALWTGLLEQVPTMGASVLAGGVTGLAAKGATMGARAAFVSGASGSGAAGAVPQIAFWTAQEGGSTFREMRRAGIREEVAAPLAIASGAVAGALEMAQGPLQLVIPKALRDEAVQAGKAAARQTMLGLLRERGEAYVKEMAEEVGQSAVAAFAKAAGERLQGEQRFDWNAEKQAFLEEMAQASRTIGLMQGAGGLAEVAAKGVRRNYRTGRDAGLPPLAAGAVAAATAVAPLTGSALLHGGAAAVRGVGAITRTLRGQPAQPAQPSELSGGQGQLASRQGQAGLGVQPVLQVPEAPALGADPRQSDTTAGGQGGPQPAVPARGGDIGPQPQQPGQPPAPEATLSQVQGTGQVPGGQVEHGASGGPTLAAPSVQEAADVAGAFLKDRLVPGVRNPGALKSPTNPQGVTLGRAAAFAELMQARGTPGLTPEQFADEAIRPGADGRLALEAAFEQVGRTIPGVTVYLAPTAEPGDMRIVGGTIRANLPTFAGELDKVSRAYPNEHPGRSQALRELAAIRAHAGQVHELIHVGHALGAMRDWKLQGKDVAAYSMADLRREAATLWEDFRRYQIELLTATKANPTDANRERLRAALAVTPAVVLEYKNLRGEIGDLTLQAMETDVVDAVLNELETAPLDDLKQRVRAIMDKSVAVAEGGFGDSDLALEGVRMMVELRRSGQTTYTGHRATKWIKRYWNDAWKMAKRIVFGLRESRRSETEPGDTRKDEAGLYPYARTVEQQRTGRPNPNLPTDPLAATILRVERLLEGVAPERRPDLFEREGGVAARDAAKRFKLNSALNETVQAALANDVYAQTVLVESRDWLLTAPNDTLRQILALLPPRVPPINSRTKGPALQRAVADWINTLPHAERIDSELGFQIFDSSPEGLDWRDDAQPTATNPPDQPPDDGAVPATPPPPSPAPEPPAPADVAPAPVALTEAERQPPSYAVERLGRDAWVREVANQLAALDPQQVAPVLASPQGEQFGRPGVGYKFTAVRQRQARLQAIGQMPVSRERGLALARMAWEVAEKFEAPVDDVGRALLGEQWQPPVLWTAQPALLPDADVRLYQLIRTPLRDLDIELQRPPQMRDAARVAAAQQQIAAAFSQLPPVADQARVIATLRAQNMLNASFRRRIVKARMEAYQATGIPPLEPTAASVQRYVVENPRQADVLARLDLDQAADMETMRSQMAGWTPLADDPASLRDLHRLIRAGVTVANQSSSPQDREAAARVLEAVNVQPVSGDPLYAGPIPRIQRNATARPSEPVGDLVSEAQISDYARNLFGLTRLVASGPVARHADALAKFISYARSVLFKNEAKLNLGVTTHEIGHLIDDDNPDLRTTGNQPAFSAVETIATPGAQDKLTEGIAEWVRLWATDRAATSRPTLRPWLDHWNGWIDQHPDVARKLDAIHGYTESLKGQTAAETTAANIVMPGRKQKKLGQTKAQAWGEWFSEMWRHIDEKFGAAHASVIEFERNAKEALKKAGLNQSLVEPVKRIVAYTHAGPVFARSMWRDGVFRIQDPGRARLAEGPESIVRDIPAQQRTEFEVYWLARAVKEARETYPDYDAGPMSLDDANEIIAEYSQRPGFEDAAKRMSEAATAIWRMTANDQPNAMGGMFSQAMVDRMLRLKNYAPLQRVVDESAGDKATGSNGGPQSAAKRRTEGGSPNPYLSPIAVLQQMYAQFASAVVTQEVYNPLMATVVPNSPSFMQNSGEILLPSQTEFTPAEMQEHRVRLIQMGVNTAGMSDAEVLRLSSVFDPKRPMGTAKGMAIRTGVWNGQTLTFQFDKNLAEGLDSVSPPPLTSGMHAVTRAVWLSFMFFNRLRRASFTGINLAFGLVRGPLLDAPTFWFQSQHALGQSAGPSRYAALPRAMYDTLEGAVRYLAEGTRQGIASLREGKSPWAVDKAVGAIELLEGAEQLRADVSGLLAEQSPVPQTINNRPILRQGPGSFIARGAGYVWRTIRTIARYAVGGLERTASAASFGMRFAESKAYLRNIGKTINDPSGLTFEEATTAIAAGREVNVPYNIAGTWGRAISGFSLYFNACVQPIRSFSKEWHRDPAAAFGKSLPLIVATVLYFLSRGDDDDYLAMTPKERFDYWHFKLPTGDRVSVPAYGTWALVTKGLTEAVCRSLNQQSGGEFGEWLTGVKDRALPLSLDMSPSGVPIPGDIAILGPAMEWLANYDPWRKAPIDRDMGRLLPGDSYDEKTASWAVTLGQALNLSPRHLEHFARGLFGNFADPSRLFSLSGVVNRPERTEGLARFWQELPQARQAALSAEKHGRPDWHALKARARLLEQYASAMADKREADIAAGIPAEQTQRALEGMARKALGLPALAGY